MKSEVGLNNLQNKNGRSQATAQDFYLVLEIPDRRCGYKNAKSPE